MRGTLSQCDTSEQPRSLLIPTLLRTIRTRRCYYQSEMLLSGRQCHYRAGEDIIERRGCRARLLPGSVVHRPAPGRHDQSPVTLFRAGLLLSLLTFVRARPFPKRGRRTGRGGGWGLYGPRNVTELSDVELRGKPPDCSRQILAIGGACFNPASTFARVMGGQTSNFREIGNCSTLPTYIYI